jgi:hypothetical protein
MSNNKPFQIQLEFSGSLSSDQRKVFEKAATRWAQVISGEGISPAKLSDGTRVDGLLIRAAGTKIDGGGGVLGQAGPTEIRRDSGIPYLGKMEFDTADLDSMEQGGTLDDVILHEMGHVLGIGTLWKPNNLLIGSGTNDPQYTGTNAMTEYAALLGKSKPTPIPVENSGGAGTREGHWRESVFDAELMTGYAEPADMPMSRMTIASLKDLGYQVNLEAADRYKLPEVSTAAVKGIVIQPGRRMCVVSFPPVKKSRRRCGCC